MSKRQKIRVFIWLVIVVVFWGWVLYEDQSLDAKQIAYFLARFQSFIIIVYFLFSSFRAFTLIPNLTVVLVGTFVIEDPYILLCLSILGFIISSSIIYFFGQQTGLYNIFMLKYSARIEDIEKKIQKFGSPIIFLWGLLPIVPSDLLTFVLGTIKFDYKKMIFLYFFSHFITYTLIIFTSKTLWKILISNL